MAIAAVGGASVVGGLISGGASSSAAKDQEKAANNAAAMQQAQYNQTRNDLMPYQQAGQNALGQEQAYMANNPYLNGSQQFSAAGGGVPYANAQGGFDFTADNLDQTPGYQFTLQQGMRGVNNSSAASGLGLSGAQLKGVANYTTGLADQTYNQQYQNALNAYNASYNNALSTYNTNYNSANNQFNRYAGISSQGENAAAQTGTLGQQAANNAGNLATQGANALAAGQVGQANALGGALSGAAGAYYAGSNPYASAASSYIPGIPSTQYPDPSYTAGSF